MHPIQAKNIIDNLVFRPGWHWHAVPFGTDSVYVDITIETFDTNYPPDYLVPKTIGPGDVIDVSSLDEDGLMYTIKKIIEAINDHEDREILRRGDRLDTEGRPEAPFHPHHPECQMRWFKAQLNDMRAMAAV